MEVHVRNVPRQSTESQLRKFLGPYLQKLSVGAFNCQKHRDKTFASLTFLRTHDGERFLQHHGQTRGTNNHRAIRASTFSVNLYFLDRPIYCEKSTKEANATLLRVLEKEEKVRLARRENKSQVPHFTALPVKFQASSIACGVWDYHHSDLVFSPQLKWVSQGILVFGERAAILTLETGIRVDFRYSATLGVTAEEGSMPCFIFSMCECPRFFEKIEEDTAVALMRALSLEPSRHNAAMKTERHRLPCLSEDHGHIAGCCLVYRISLRHSIAIHIGEQMHSLQQARGLPVILYRHIDVQLPAKLYIQEFKQLQHILSNPSTRLPFNVGFQIFKLAQNGYLSPTKVLGLIQEIKKIYMRSSEAICVGAVRKLFPQIPYPGPEIDAEIFEHDALINQLRENEKSCKLESSRQKDPVPASENVAIIHRVRISPSGFTLYGPEPESNNRVLRKYSSNHQYFIRVQFCDEDSEPVRFNFGVSNEKIFHGRFQSILNNGIQIAGRLYEFLGFSNSSLRAQSVWFMAPFIQDGTLMYDRMVIRELGSFSVIRSPAKCAARIGQAFSDTRTAIEIGPTVRVDIQDIERCGRCFSDGVGTLSTSLTRKIWGRLPKATSSKPTCFQIRFQGEGRSAAQDGAQKLKSGIDFVSLFDLTSVAQDYLTLRLLNDATGAKGMIALDSRLEGDVLAIRPSMDKFHGSNATDIEICEAAYNPLPMYLNRQLIKILEDMGVNESFFLNLQAKEVRRLRMITTSPFNASTFLKRQSIGEAVQLPWLINRLSNLNINFRSDGFLRDVVEIAVLVELRLLKHKTRIPVKKGWHLHGLMDETGFLGEGQIYCTTTVDGIQRVVEGTDLIISRAPALHPGDVQMVEGVVPPPGSPLWQLRNCICFSQKGNRDLPSMLSGGDLDGDRYYIMWDENAVPKQCFEPADYSRQPAIDIGRTVTREDMTEFFIQFMETDQLGRIAVAHRILADRNPLGTRDPDCITLAEMHSTAVDFSKTGIPVDISKMPPAGRWRPDFEAPGPHVRIESKTGIAFEKDNEPDPDREEENDDFSTYRYYESFRVLGKLYRNIDERDIFAGIQRCAAGNSPSSTYTVIPQIWEHIQKKCRLIQWEHHTDWAEEIRDMYEDCLQNIMIEYGSNPLRPLTELEAFIGNILGRTGAQSKRQRDLSTTMKDKFEIDAHFVIECIVRDGPEHSSESLERSMACLAVSLEDRVAWKGKQQLLSFKYVAAAVCLREMEFAGL